MTTTPVDALSPLTLYEAALDGLPVAMVHAGGTLPLDVGRWAGAATTSDDVLLDRCRGPVLDVGCGPGRLAAELSRRGVDCLGIDVSRDAVRRARDRGAVAMRRAVEAALPDEGTWRTVLLADGNIGIGGDPAALLARCRELVRPDGQILVETDPHPDAHDTSPVVLRAADGRLSRPVPWARVGARRLPDVASAAGLSVVAQWSAGGRTVVALAAARGPR